METTGFMGTQGWDIFLMDMGIDLLLSHMVKNRLNQRLGVALLSVGWSRFQSFQKEAVLIWLQSQRADINAVHDPKCIDRSLNGKETFAQILIEILLCFHDLLGFR